MLHGNWIKVNIYNLEHRDNERKKASEEKRFTTEYSSHQKVKPNHTKMQKPRQTASH
jgi:hypothetical protein